MADHPMDRPSIERAASCGYLLVPWTKRPVTLGQGFFSQAASQAQVDPFSQYASAFDDTAMRDAEVLYHPQDDCRGTYTSASISRSTNSTEHLSLSLGIGVGNEYLGASVTGSYDKSVLENKALNKSSRQASFHAGTLHWLEVPPLSTAALEILASPSDGLKAFLAIYGDFYVSALVIGADAGILVSQATSDRATQESAKIVAEVHALIWSDSETVMDRDLAERSACWHFGVTAFDTLSGSFVDVSIQDDEGLDLSDARRLVKECSRRLEQLSERTRNQLRTWPWLVGNDDKAKWVELEGLLQSGLVSKIILVPFATLRQVRSYM